MSNNFNNAGKGKNYKNYNKKNTAVKSSRGTAISMVNSSHRYLLESNASGRFIFSSGSAVEFSLARPKMIAEFKKENCYSLVEVDPQIMIPDAVGNYPAIPPETVFDEPEPPAFVENVFVGAKTAQANAIRDQDLLQLEAFNGHQIAVLERNKLILDIHRKHREAIGRIQQDIISTSQAFRNNRSDWRDKKEKHDLKVSKIFRVFDRCFGPGPKSVIRNQLNLNHFREAWVMVNRHYYVGHGGRESAQQLNSLLSNLKYEKIGHYENLAEHINFIHHLAAEYQFASGHVLPDFQILQHLQDSLKRCPEAKKDFRLILEQLETNMNITLVGFIDMLQRSVSRIITREQTSELAISETTSLVREEDEPSSNVATNKEEKYCDCCKVNNHNTGDCWILKKYIKAICDGRIKPKLPNNNDNKNNNKNNSSMKNNKNRNNKNNNNSSSNKVTRFDDRTTKESTQNDDENLVDLLTNFNKTTGRYSLTLLLIHLLDNVIYYHTNTLPLQRIKLRIHYMIRYLYNIILINFILFIYEYVILCIVVLLNMIFTYFGTINNVRHCDSVDKMGYSGDNTMDIIPVHSNVEGDTYNKYEKYPEYTTSSVSYHYDCCVTGHHISIEDNDLKESENFILSDNISNALLNIYNSNFVFTTMNNMNLPFLFIFDTGATCNMIPKLNELLDDYSTVKGFVTLGSNEYKLPIIGKGTLPILNDVIYVPGLKFGLISISYFDRLGFDIGIKNGCIRIIDSENGMIILSGYLHDSNLYFLDHKYYKIILNNENDNVVTCMIHHHDRNLNEETNTVDITQDESIDTLHRRWGHIGVRKLKEAYKNKSVIGLKRTYEDVKNDILSTCPACLKGSMKARNISHGDTTKSKSVKWNPLEKISIDYKGDFPVRSVHGYYGFFLLCDHHSGYVYAHMVNSKKKMIEALKAFHSGVVAYCNGNWKILQSDYDSVINSELVKQWLLKNKIKLQLSAPYLHYQNGFVERQIQTVMDKARTMMMDMNVPPKYWEYAISNACYYINRTPNRDNFLTPYEIIMKEKPDISHFVPFFCPGYFHVSVAERHQQKNRSWSSKAEPCRMLGYDEKCKGSYFVLNTRTRKILSRPNCVFDSNLTMDELNEIYDEEFQKFLEEQSKEEEIFDDIDKLTDIEMRSENDRFTDVQEDLEDEEESEKKQLLEKLKVQPLSTENIQKLSSSSDINAMEKKKNEDISDDEGATDAADDESSNNIVLICYDVKNSRGIKKSKAKELLDKWNEFLHWYNDTCYIVHHLSLPPTPRNTEEALAGPNSEDWLIAIRKELQQMNDKKMFSNAPQEGRAMKTKLVFRVTFNNDYTLKFKARFVVCGYTQILGLDYDETYAPTVSTIVVLLVLNYIIINQLVYGSFDIKGAFLEGKPDKKLFCRLPPELSGWRKVGMRVEILRNIYGEKQAPKIWNEHFDKILIELHFTRCSAEPCLYFWCCEGRGIIIICIHVDDGLIGSNDKSLIDEFIKNLSKYVEVNFFYPANRFVGMDMIMDKAINQLKLYQTVYIDEKLEKLAKAYDINISSSDRLYNIPMSPLINLRIAEPNEKNDSLLNITGSLRYLADKTRKDISASTGEVSCGGAKHPSDEHVKVAKQIVGFILKTKDQYLSLGGKEPVELFGFCDAAYVTHGNSRSRLGGCLFLSKDTGAFYSFSKLATTVCHSSTEAEIKALDELARSIVWIRDILAFLQCPMDKPTKIYMDNKSAIQLCEIFKMNHKVRHINVRINYIRELINSKIIELHFVSTELNIADVLTKPLYFDLYTKHSNILLHGFKQHNVSDILLHNTHFIISHIDYSDENIDV